MTDLIFFLSRRFGVREFIGVHEDSVFGSVNVSDDLDNVTGASAPSH